MHFKTTLVLRWRGQVSSALVVWLASDNFSLRSAALSPSPSCRPEADPYWILTGRGGRSNRFLLKPAQSQWRYHTRALTSAVQPDKGRLQ